MNNSSKQNCSPFGRRSSCGSKSKSYSNSKRNNKRKSKSYSKRKSYSNRKSKSYSRRKSKIEAAKINRKLMRPCHRVP